jgi:hypothetical protein
VSKLRVEEMETSSPSAGVEQDEVPLNLALKELRYVTHRTQRNSSMVSTITLLHVTFALVIAFYFSTPVVISRTYSVNLFFLMLLEIALLILSISALLLYDRLISRGDAIYQEISDELEWQVKGLTNATDKKVPVYSSSKERPGLSVRLALRDFVLAARLPLVRGSQGGTYYLFINMAVGLLVFVVLVIKSNAVFAN